MFVIQEGLHAMYTLFNKYSFYLVKQWKLRYDSLNIVIIIINSILNMLYLENLITARTKILLFHIKMM